jgi:hypothetical protein
VKNNVCAHSNMQVFETFSLLSLASEHTLLCAQLRMTDKSRVLPLCMPTMLLKSTLGSS